MSLNRFAEAEAAFQAGRRDEGKRLMAEQLEADTDAPAAGYRNLGAILIRDRDYALAETVGRRAVERHPRDPELWNILGVALRRLKRSSRNSSGRPLPTPSSSVSLGGPTGSPRISTRPSSASTSPPG